MIDWLSNQVRQFVGIADHVDTLSSQNVQPYIADSTVERGAIRSTAASSGAELEHAAWSRVRRLDELRPEFRLRRGRRGR